MIYMFTRVGVVAISGNIQTWVALREAGLSIVDDLANIASQVDDANGLANLVQSSFSGNGLGAI